MGYMDTDAAQRLHQLVGASHSQTYCNSARFRATIDAALHGSTRDDVMALLVRGLAEACQDTEAMRTELQELIERRPGPMIVTYPSTEAAAQATERAVRPA